MNIKLLHDNAIVPTRGSDYAAGYDLYSTESAEIQPHSTHKVHTGIAIELPQNCFGGIYARSGLATKRFLRPANCAGIIDEDYRGEVIVALHNDSNEVQSIVAGERIAQLIVQRYEHPILQVVENLSDTNRGDGGFGSTGRN